MSDLRELELTLEMAREKQARGEAMKRLEANPDFQEIVVKGYIEQEAQRLAHMMSAPNLRPDARECVARDIMGPGAITRYFYHIHQEGHLAAAAIEETLETMDEVRADDAEEVGE